MLNLATVKSLGMQALIAGAAASLTYLSHAIAGADVGTLGAFLAAGLSLALAALHRAVPPAPPAAAPVAPAPAPPTMIAPAPAK